MLLLVSLGLKGRIIVDTIIPPPKPPILVGSGNSSNYTRRIQDKEKNIIYNRIFTEDDEMLTIIKIFLQCQK